MSSKFSVEQTMIGRAVLLTACVVWFQYPGSVTKAPLRLCVWSYLRNELIDKAERQHVFLPL